MATQAPVFVCGLGRSGTTWISAALGKSPELDYIGEAWLIAKLEELAEWFTQLHEDWESFTPWKRRGVDRRAFVARLADSYRDLLETAADGRRVVEKTPDWNALHLPFLRELFPDAHFVLVYRDGRNCIASLEAMKARQGEPFEFEASCRRWALAMDIFSEVTEVSSHENTMLVRYEDMLQDFDTVFDRLCEFIGIASFRPPPRPPNSSFGTAAAADDFNSRWQAWPARKQRTFKRSAGRQLVAWGYASPDEDW
jgi:hypothetical protein